MKCEVKERKERLINSSRVIYLEIPPFLIYSLQ